MSITINARSGMRPFISGAHAGGRVGTAGPL
jgi:hypothetical protein